MNSLPSTIAEMLQNVSEKHDEHCELYYRAAARWQVIEYKEFYDNIQCLAASLVQQGLKKGECVGLMAQSSPMWLMADLAIIMAGGISVPFFIPFSRETFRYKVKDAGLRYLILLENATWELLHRELSSFKCVITSSFAKPHENTFLLNDCLIQGQKTISEEGWRGLPSVRPSDIFSIIYTSGSEGYPKGVPLTHTNIMSQIHGAAERFPLYPQKDRAFSCLPLAHSFERMVVYYYIYSGIPIYFADDIKNTGPLIRDMQPTTMTVVPRLLEKVFMRMETKVGDKTGIARWLVQRAWRRAQKRRKVNKGWLDKVWDSLVYRKLREGLGGNLRYIISGGAPLNPSLYWFFKNIGLPVYQGYGLTEASPVICSNSPTIDRIGTVGKPFPGVEIRCTDQGELLARGPGVMKGYHKQPDKTGQTIDKEGWLHTGDLVQISEDGFTTITGRIKEMYKTSGGKYVSPVPIEQQFQESRLVNLAMIVGEGRPFVSCLIFPDLDELQIYKGALHRDTMEDTLFVESPPVIKYMERLMHKVNSTLPHWEKVQKYCFVLAQPSVESGELTPTMKLRRHVIREKYREQMDNMYLGTEA